MEIPFSYCFIFLFFLSASASHKQCVRHIPGFVDGLENTLLINNTWLDREKLKSNCELWLEYDTSRVLRIEGNTFSNLSIDGLILSGRNNTFVDDRAFDGMPVLRSLVIKTYLRFWAVSDDGHIDDETQVLAAVANVTHLEYSFNKNEKINKVLQVFTELKSLKMTGTFTELSYNTFKHVSPSLDKLELATTGNLLIDSRAFAALKNLTQLIITDVTIDFIDPGAFADMPKLKVLSIWFNSDSFVTTLPRHIFNKLGLLEMKLLKIRRDRTSNFHGIVKLDSLLFSGFKIDTLDLSQLFFGDVVPETFEGLTVENLHLQINQIVQIFPNSFVGSNITNLYLWNSRFQSFTVHFFREQWGISNTTRVIFNYS